LQPAQFAHFEGHWESLVHQHGTFEAVHVPVGDVTVLQLPTGHVQAISLAVAVRQSWLSAGDAPLQVPLHWLSLLTHLPLEQSESATQRQADWSDLSTGAG
jgi:hypothetical protein